jgi:hypothetical protein
MAALFRAPFDQPIVACDPERAQWSDEDGRLVLREGQPPGAIVLTTRLSDELRMQSADLARESANAAGAAHVALALA